MLNWYTSCSGRRPPNVADVPLLAWLTITTSSLARRVRMPMGRDCQGCGCDRSHDLHCHVTHVAICARLVMMARLEAEWPMCLQPQNIQRCYRPRMLAVQSRLLLWVSVGQQLGPSAMLHVPSATCPLPVRAAKARSKPPSNRRREEIQTLRMACTHLVRTIQLLFNHFSLNVIKRLCKCLHELLALHLLQRT